MIKFNKRHENEASFSKTFLLSWGHSHRTAQYSYQSIAANTLYCCPGEQEEKVELKSFTLTEWKNFTNRDTGNNATESRSPTPTSVTQFPLRAASLPASTWNSAVRCEHVLDVLAVLACIGSVHFQQLEVILANIKFLTLPSRWLKRFTKQTFAQISLSEI